MVSLSESRRERKKAETRERILDAAVRSFTQKGIAHVTVDEIAAAADIGKGTLYNYFATKEEILVAFIVRLEGKIQDQVRTIGRRGRSLESILTAFVRLQLKLKEPYHAFVRVFLGQLLSGESTASPWVQELQTVMDPPLEDLFSRLRQRGLIRTDITDPHLIMIFKTIQMGITCLWAMEGPPWKGTEKVLRTEIKLFCSGLERKTCD